MGRPAVSVGCGGMVVVVVEVVVVKMKENGVGEEMEYASCHRTR